MVKPGGALPQSGRGLALALALAAFAAGCRDAPPVDAAPGAAGAAPAAETPRLETTRFADELGVELERMTRLEDGIYVRDARTGRGPAAAAGRSVVVQYRAWLPDGTLFEQRPSPEGFGASEFVLGENAPVEGLNAAVAGMRPGGVRTIVLGPERGYGLVGRPAGVPAGLPLVFEVTLLRVAD
jgi:FKBP-type peptidyl-prolyl cis-trans isomerase